MHVAATRNASQSAASSTAATNGGAGDADDADAAASAPAHRASEQSLAAWRPASEGEQARRSSSRGLDVHGREVIGRRGRSRRASAGRARRIALTRRMVRASSRM